MTTIQFVRSVHLNF